MIVRIGQSLHGADILGAAKSLLGKWAIETDRITRHLVFQRSDALLELLGLFGTHGCVQRRDDAKESSLGRCFRQGQQLQGSRGAGKIRRLVTYLELWPDQ